MSCDEILELVGEEVLKGYRNLHHTRGLRPGDRDVNYVGEGPGEEAAMDPAGADGDAALVDDDDDDEPARMAVCAFVANNLNAGSNRGSWKPLQQGWKKKEKKDPRRFGNPPLSFGEFIRAHPQGCFVCYGTKQGFNHDHRTCPIHQADTEAYKKAHESKKRAPAGIREAKVEVDKDKLSKLMSVGTKLAKEIQEIKRNWVPRSGGKNKENKENDKSEDKDKKGRKRGKRNGVNEVDAEESTPTTTTRDGPLGHLGRPPEPKLSGVATPQVRSVVQVPGKAKAESDDCRKIQALRARLKQKYGDTFFSGKPVFPPPVRGPYGEAKLRLK